jgi:hypothetical protein
MIGRRAVVGLSLLSALLFSAFAAQSASAVSASNTTGFTCVENGVGDFTDAHCDTAGVKGNEKFGHVALAESKTEFQATNGKVTESTKKSEPAVLKSKVAGAKITIECTTVKNETENSILNSVEKEKKHNIEGVMRIDFSTCSVKELTKCDVAEPIVVEGVGGGVEGLKGPKGEANAMGGEVKGKGAEETFTTIAFENKGAEACAVNGKSFPVNGSAIATNGPTTESAQNSKHSGTTVVYTPKFEMQKLQLGVETCEFTLITTVAMAGPEGKPITTTTVT